MAKGGIPLEEFSGAAATNALREAIERFQEENGRHTQTMVRLTWAMTALTVVMAIGLGVQIWLTFYPPAHP